MLRCTNTYLLCAGLLATVGGLPVFGCGDQVVDYLSADSQAPTTTNTGQTSTTTIGSPSGGATGNTGSGEPQPFTPPGCYGDDFSDAPENGIWNTFTSAGGTVDVQGGQLRLHPAPVRVESSGVVSNYLYRTDFVNASARVQVIRPPGPSDVSVLFFQVFETDGPILSIVTADGRFSVSGELASGEPVFELEFPEVVNPPWIGIRAANGQLFFEVSQDGQQWQVVTAQPAFATLQGAHPLIMALPLADAQDQPPLIVDNFEFCVDA